MNRRRMLALCGLCVSGSAGCLSGWPPQSSDGPGDETDDGPGGGTGTTDDGSAGTPATDAVDVEDVVVRKAVRYESSMGSGGVLAADDRQYVVASARTARDVSASDFAFVTDSESWDPGLPDTVGAVNYAVAGHEGGPAGRALGGGDRSYLAFSVPSPLSASNPRIRFEQTGAAWPLPDEMRDRLAAPSPRFELDSFEAPGAVSQGETLSVSLSVTNVSDTDGRFLAAVYWPTKLIADDDESHVVERTVAAGDDVTASLALDTEYTTAEEESVTLSVRGHVVAERDVEVQDASTPA